MICLRSNVAGLLCAGLLCGLACPATSSFAQQDAKGKPERDTPVYKVGNNVKPPVPVSAPDPHYPEDLRIKRVQGVVALDVVIGEDGNVRQVSVKRRLDPRLDAEAVKAVQTWKFRPGTKDGTPVATSIDIQVRFLTF
jgi:TonB family protein